MANPENPDEAECKVCFDSGTIPGTYKRCHYCLGDPIRTLGPDTTPRVFPSPKTETKETQDGC